MDKRQRYHPLILDLAQEGRRHKPVLVDRSQLGFVKARRTYAALKIDTTFVHGLWRESGCHEKASIWQYFTNHEFSYVIGYPSASNDCVASIVYHDSVLSLRQQPGSEDQRQESSVDSRVWI